MIILLAILAGLLMGYLLADLLDGIMIQVQANHIRKDVGLSKRPVQIRRVK